MAAGGPGPSPPGGKSRVEGRGAAGGLGTLSCPAPAGPPPAGARRTSPRALPCRPLAPRRGGSRERRAETAPSAMSAAGLSESDSGGRPDSCQTVPACPLPPLRKGLRENFQRGRGPEPTPVWVPGTAAPRKGLKSLPNLGTGRGEGGARARQQGEVEAPRCPAGSEPGRGGVGGDEGFPGSAGHDRLPRLPEAALPAAPSRASIAPGSRCPSGKDAGPARPAALGSARPRRSPAAPGPRTTRRPAGQTPASRHRRPHPPARGGTDWWGSLT